MCQISYARYYRFRICCVDTTKFPENYFDQVALARYNSSIRKHITGEDTLLVKDAHKISGENDAVIVSMNLDNTKSVSSTIKRSDVDKTEPMPSSSKSSVIDKTGPVPSTRKTFWLSIIANPYLPPAKVRTSLIKCLL